jgi:hypothetical protein
MKLLPISLVVAFALGTGVNGDACSDACEAAKVVCDTACAVDIFDEPECGYACHAIDTTCDAACLLPTPTSPPTEPPTEAPTAHPTASPTRTPTRKPTVYPTFSLDPYSLEDEYKGDFAADSRPVAKTEGSTRARASKAGPSLRGNGEDNKPTRTLSSLEFKARVASIAHKALCGLGNHDKTRAALLCDTLGKLSSANL